MDVLQKRLQSFAWRLGVVAALAVINYLIVDVTNWGLSTEWVTIIGLAGGEVTKWLNTK